MLESTSKYKVVEIIYNDGRFALAKGYWDGDKTELRLACRWHETEIGYPQTFGKPQWMMLPEGLKVDVFNALAPTDSEVRVTFG
jgi:hypothetical protein